VAENTFDVINLANGEPDYGLYDYTRKVQAISSGFTLWAGEVFSSLRFNKEVSRFYNEVDLCLRARLKNYDIYYYGHNGVIFRQNFKIDSYPTNLSKKYSASKKYFKNVWEKQIKTNEFLREAR